VTENKRVETVECRRFWDEAEAREFAATVPGARVSVVPPGGDARWRFVVGWTRDGSPFPAGGGEQ
jgi:hypothetical protein